MRSITDLSSEQLKNKRVIWRVAFDVPLKTTDNQTVMADDYRIRAALPTLKFLLEHQAKVIVMSWLGRPAGYDLKFSLAAVVPALERLIRRPVKFVAPGVGIEAEQAVAQMLAGEVLVLENTRFRPEDEANDSSYAQALARLGDLVVFDALAQAHRQHASTTGLLERLPSVAGLLMTQEMQTLSRLLAQPQQPFVVIMSGAKVGDKIATIEALSQSAAIILLGSGLAQPFWQAQGYEINEAGRLKAAENETASALDIARKLWSRLANHPATSDVNSIPDPDGQTPLTLNKLQLALDIMVASEQAGQLQAQELIIRRVDGHTRVLAAAGEVIVDIGPYTIAIYEEVIRRAKTIFWNGPMGVFEDFDFSRGTRAIAGAIARSQAFSVIGGGDTEEVVHLYHLEDKFGYVSTGGGATLHFLAHGTLPVLKYL